MSQSPSRASPDTVAATSDHRAAGAESCIVEIDLESGVPVICFRLRKLGICSSFSHVKIIIRLPDRKDLKQQQPERRFILLHSAVTQPVCSQLSISRLYILYTRNAPVNGSSSTHRRRQKMPFTASRFSDSEQSSSRSRVELINKSIGSLHRLSARLIYDYTVESCHRLLLIRST